MDEIDTIFSNIEVNLFGNTKIVSLKYFVNLACAARGWIEYSCIRVLAEYTQQKTYKF